MIQIFEKKWIFGCRKYFIYSVSVVVQFFSCFIILVSFVLGYGNVW